MSFNRIPFNNDLLQGFQIPNLYNSFRVLRTRWNSTIGCRVVHLRDINAVFGPVHLIEANGSEVSFLHQPGTLSLLHPRQIRAYPELVLKVYYSSTDNVTSLDQALQLLQGLEISEDENEEGDPFDDDHLDDDYFTDGEDSDWNTNSIIDYTGC